MRKIIFIIIPWLLFIVTGAFLYHQCTEKPVLALEKEETVSIINHQMVVERVESLGKLELVKFYIKDIVEHQEIIDWWPDSKAVLLVAGEVVGCIDLTKIDTTDIFFNGDNLYVVLPDPEICYHKVDHKGSKVYDVKSFSIQNFFPVNTTKENADLIDKAYKQAEIQLAEAASEMKLLEQTKANARVVLKPLLENFSGKKVTVSFKDQNYTPPAAPADTSEMLQ